MNSQGIGTILQGWLARSARKLGVSPNVITVVALLVMIAAGAQVLAAQMQWAAILIIISGALDALDGAVARATGRQTRFGALLDRVSDRIADALILIAAIVALQVDLYIGLFALVSMLLASYISACLEAATGSAIGERLSMRAVRLIVLAVACFVERLADGVMIIAAIATWSLVSRLWIAWRLLR